MKRNATFLMSARILCISIMALSCTSPQKALENGHNKTAFGLALFKIKRNKEVESNKQVLDIAANELVKDEMEKNAEKLNSSDVNDWIKVRNRYYDLLVFLGKANIQTDGYLNGPYDRLCEDKLEVDFKIIDHYYQKGMEELVIADETQNKGPARNAYYEFGKSKKFGAENIYGDLDNLMEECIDKGTVYFIAKNFNLGNRLFLQELPENASFEPDCVAEANFGYVSTDKSVSESSSTYKKEVIDHYETEKDTSGSYIQIPVYKEIEATVIERKITITVSQSIDVYVEDITGQCSLHNDWFTVDESETYEEIEIDGDSNALDFSISEKSGNAFFTENDLKSDLERSVEWRLRIPPSPVLRP